MMGDQLETSTDPVKTASVDVSPDTDRPANDTIVTPPTQSDAALSTASGDSFITPPSRTLSCSEEQTNSLAFINEELNFLNQASGGLATNIHKSNKQVRQDLARKNRESSMRRRELYKSPLKRFGAVSSRGLKRSPAKLSFRRANKIRRKMTDSGPSSNETAFQSNDEDDDEYEESSEDDEDGWQILEDSDAEIDKTLEANAQKSNLTATNVKSILHQVITNEHVVAMVRNSLMSENERVGDVEEAPYEPKMTRSKVKHIMEEEGDIPHPWPLSPLKQPRLSVPKILDLEFSEDEEDDEYDPDKESHSLSDEDSESVTSSHVSDIGSPIPSTPRTPHTPQSSSKLSDISMTPSTRSAVPNEDSLQSPMGPPVAPFLRSKTTLGRRYQDAMASTNDGLTEEETIALRTRSKLSLAETSLNEIESTFVAPDITADMYDTECDDKDWQSFLTSLVKPSVEAEDTNDGCEDEDPEYNFLEEKELQEDIKEDQRDDRAVRVSKKEMHELMDELLEAYEESTDIPEEEREKLKLQARTNLLMTNKKTKKPARSGGSGLSSGLRITESERRQLDDQMRKHVQLLTQIYVVAQSNQSEYSSTISSCEFLLRELKTFATTSSVLVEGTSAFNPCNLDPAIQLISEPREWKQLIIEKGKQFETPEKSLTSLLVKNYHDLSKQQKDEILGIVDDPGGRNLCDPKNLQTNSTLPPLTKQQKNILWNSPVFLYPSLLPQTGLLTSVQLAAKKRVTFTEAEDNLLALGYEQFSRYPLHRELIQKFLLPCKTPEQIKIRIKNLTAAKTPNVIKTLKSTKQLPDFLRFDDEFEPCQLLAPKDQTVTRQYPVWCKEFKIKEIIGVSNEGSSIKRASSVTLPVSAKRKSVELKDKPRSAPSTPAELLATKSFKPLCPKPVKSVSLESECINRETLGMNSPKPKNIHSLLKQDARPCKSPGFIALDDLSMEAEGPSSPVNVRRLDRDLFPSPSRLVSQPSPKSVTHIAADSSKIPAPMQLSEPVEIRPCLSTPVVIIQGSPAVTCTAPTFVVINNTGTVTTVTVPQTQAVMSVTMHSSSNMVSTPPVSQTQTTVSLVSSDTTVTTPQSMAAENSSTLTSVTATPVTVVSSSVVPVCTSVSAGCVTKSSDNSSTCDCSMQTSVASSSGCNTTSSIATSVTTSLVSPSSYTEKDRIKTVYLSPSPSADLLTSPVSLSSPASVKSVSSVQSDVQTTPKKSALEIITSYGPFIYSPSKNAIDLSPVKNYTLSQEMQERTPTKSYTPRYRPVVPNPFTTSPVKTVSPFLEKKVASPRRKQLNKKAQAICPKGFIIKNYVSPSKKAATNIVQRVLKRGTQKILPKPQSAVKSDFALTVRNLRLKASESQDEDDDGNLSKQDTASEYDTMESECLSDENIENDNLLNTDADKSLSRSGNKSQQKRRRKRYESHRSMESDDTQSETEDIADLYDSQNDDEEEMDDEDHLAELMAASTTIGFPQKKIGPKDKDNRSKAKKKKDSTLAMLAPDLLSHDPHKDDRDTAFAQAYLTRAKDILKDDLEIYEAFLRLLYDFGKSDQSPVKLYGELVTVLKGYPDLIHDFAGFLLPEQAVECGCFMATQEFIRARIFLRKLEIHFERHPSHFQKCMKVLCKWSQKPSKKVSELRDALEPLIKGHSHLLEELSTFFEDEHPPESYLTDYEEIMLGDSDEDLPEDFDGFEEVVLPEEEEVDGTKKCQCKCHHSMDSNFRKRNQHCYSCCLKVIDGELYYRVNSKVQKKVKVIFHKPIKARSQQPVSPVKKMAQEEWFEDDTGAEKENVDITILPDLSKSRAMNIKMKISHRKKAKGRFLTLNEAAESPQKMSGEDHMETSAKLERLTDEPRHYDIGPGHSEDDIVNKDLYYQNNANTSSQTSGTAFVSDKSQTVTFEMPDSAVTDNLYADKNYGSSADVTMTEKSSSLLPKQAPRLDVVDEVACLSPRKPPCPATGILQAGEIGSASNNSTSSDILAKAVKVAMIGKSDLSIDTLFGAESKSHSGFVREAANSAFSVVRYLGQSLSSTVTSLASSVVSSSDDVIRKLSDTCDGQKIEPSHVTSTVRDGCQPDGQKMSTRLTISNNTVLHTKLPGNDILLEAVEDGVSSSNNKNVESDALALQQLYKDEVPKTIVPINCFINIANEISGQSSTASAGFNVSKSNSDATENSCNNVTSITATASDMKKHSYSSSASSQHSSPQPGNFLCGNIVKEPGTPEIASSVIGFGVDKNNCSELSGEGTILKIHDNVEDVSYDSVTDCSQLSGQGAESPSGNRLSDDSSSNSHHTWSREADRLILESVKINGPSGKTFEKLSKQLGDRTAAEISKRFHCLLELLAEEETPSEDEDDKSSSSQ